MFMLGITTFMFILGLIALVLETALGFQQIHLFLDPTSDGIWSSNHTNIIIAVGATITRIMVGFMSGLHGLSALTSIYSVYSE
jgi:hypothetical protein